MSPRDDTHRKNIIQVTQDLLDDMTKRHNKILPVRVDVRFPAEYLHDGSNREAQNLAKRVQERYRYEGIDCRYVGVREQNASDKPHYHFLWLIDGNQLQSPQSVKNLVNNRWSDIVGSDAGGLVDYCHPRAVQTHPPLEMIRRPSSKATGEKLSQQQQNFEKTRQITLDHAEYLAKEHSKGSVPEGVRELLASQVNRKKRN